MFQNLSKFEVDLGHDSGDLSLSSHFFLGVIAVNAIHSLILRIRYRKRLPLTCLTRCPVT